MPAQAHPPQHDFFDHEAPKAGNQDHPTALASQHEGSQLHGPGGNPGAAAALMGPMYGQEDPDTAAKEVERSLMPGALQRAQQTGELNLAVTGIFNGKSANDPKVADDFNRFTGRKMDGVLANNNGPWQAYWGMANQGEQGQLIAIGRAARTLGFRLNVVSHSNGFQAVAGAAKAMKSEGGAINTLDIVAPNIGASKETLGTQLKDIRQATTGTASVTVHDADFALNLTQAAGQNTGPVDPRYVSKRIKLMFTQAGFDRVEVISGNDHSMTSYADDRHPQQPNHGGGGGW